MQMKDIQNEILENKRRHNFNTTNIEQEFCYLYGEVSEAYEAYFGDGNHFGEELADVANFTLGIAEIKGIDLATEILKVLAKRENYVLHENFGIAMQTKDTYPEAGRQMRDVQREVYKSRVFNEGKQFCELYVKVGKAYEVYYKGWDTFAEKLADVIILLMEIAESNAIDLGDEIVRKVEKNKSREYKRNQQGYMVHL